MTVEQKSTKTATKKTATKKIFQGIGIIGGRIKKKNSKKFFIEIEGETFRLKYNWKLKKYIIPHIEKYPNEIVYFKVYPGFDLSEQKIFFKAIRFYAKKPKSTPVNQFFLAGIWQYIPSLPNQPVVSIYRNELKEEEKIENVKIHHIPLDGFTEEAYSNPPKIKGCIIPKGKFYELLVQFNPQQRAFNYLHLLDSTEEIPPYINKKYKKAKASQSKLTVKIKEMNFSALQKTAISLRESGFLDGKVSGKDITKKALSAKVRESLKNHPEAEKVLLNKNFT